MLGQGRHVRDLAYLYFSAGFGGSVISGGGTTSAWPTWHAGEFASILPSEWPQPNLEALRRHFRGAGQFYPNIHAMIASLDPDHPAIDAWLNACVPSLSLVVSAIAATIDPEIIVLGGRLPGSLSTKSRNRLRPFRPKSRR